MLFWHPQPELDPSTDQTGSKKGYGRVPKYKLAKSHLLKIFESFFTKDPNPQGLDLVKNIPELCTNVHMIFKSLKDHTRGIRILIMSLAQIYQCYIQIRILTCKKHEDHHLAILILINGSKAHNFQLPIY